DPFQPVTLADFFGGILFGSLTTPAPYAGTYTSVINPPNGFTAGASGDTTDIIVTYSLINPPTNAAPVFNVHSIDFGNPPGATFTTTVTPQDFVNTPPGITDPDGDPLASLRFSDGTTSKTLTFDPCTSSIPLTIVATDDPSA